jgi:hypothetical protein
LDISLSEQDVALLLLRGLLLKKLDGIILVAVFAVGLAAFFLMNHTGGSADSPGKYAEVYVKNELVETISLSGDRLIEVENPDGYNLLQVKDGRIRMVEADCHSQTCVHLGAQSLPGQTIVCLPNRVVVKITGASDAPAPEDVDVVTR